VASRDDSDDATESDSDESSASSSSSDSDASSASSAPVVRPKRVSRVSRSSARQVSDDDVPAGGGEASDDEEDAELERLRKETDPYGEDGYGDAEDRKTLMAMTELERQTILADRGEKVGFGHTLDIGKCRVFNRISSLDRDKPIWNVLSFDKGSRKAKGAKHVGCVEAWLS